MEGYIRTYSGKKFYPTNPQMEEIDIVDIAHALSYICRGNGHVKNYFSVGQHCVNCAKEAMARGYSKRLSLACLLHDAGEAYMSDVPRPLKQYLPRYEEYENKILNLVYKKYIGSLLSKEDELLIRKIDDEMLYFDLKYLLEEPTDEVAPIMKSKFSWEYRSFIEVEEEYLELFKILMKK